MQLSKRLGCGLVMFPIAVLFCVGLVIIEAGYTAATASRSAGIWPPRVQAQWDVVAILQPPWRLRLEVSVEPEPQRREIPIWNQNRSGDAFTAVLLSLIAPVIIFSGSGPPALNFWARFERLFFGL